MRAQAGCFVQEFMKALLIAMSVAGLFLLSGCEDEHHEHRGGTWEGGAYEGSNSGHDRDGDHHWDHDHDRQWNYPDNHVAPYQGYPNYNGYPNHY